MQWQCPDLWSTVFPSFWGSRCMMRCLILYFSPPHLSFPLKCPIYMSWCFPNWVFPLFPSIVRKFWRIIKWQCCTGWGTGHRVGFCEVCAIRRVRSWRRWDNGPIDRSSRPSLSAADRCRSLVWRFWERLWVCLERNAIVGVSGGIDRAVTPPLLPSRIGWKQDWGTWCWWAWRIRFWGGSY